MMRRIPHFCILNSGAVLALRRLRTIKYFSTSTKSESKSQPISLSCNIYEPPAGKPRHCPVLMTHGLLGSKQNWNTVAKAVARATVRKVITFDARNHGDSPHTPHITYDAMAKDILILADQLQIDKFSILGHSMGGRTVMTLALRHPERVEKLVVVDISPFSMAGEFKQMRSFLDALKGIGFEEPVQLSEARKIADTMLAKVTSDPNLRAFLLTNLAKDSDRVYWKANLAGLVENLEELKQFPEELLSYKFNSPALFIRGGKSNYILDEDIAKIGSIFVNSRVETIQNSGHWPQADNSTKFIKILVKFLNEESSSPGK